MGSCCPQITSVSRKRYNALFNVAKMTFHAGKIFVPSGESKKLNTFFKMDDYIDTAIGGYLKIIKAICSFQIFHMLLNVFWNMWYSC